MERSSDNCHFDRSSPFLYDWSHLSNLQDAELIQEEADQEGLQSTLWQ